MDETVGVKFFAFEGGQFADDWSSDCSGEGVAEVVGVCVNCGETVILGKVGFSINDGVLGLEDAGPFGGLVDILLGLADVDTDG
jgi:hypothetical protein